MAIHIGKTIKEELYKQGISVSAFARKINRSRNVIYDIFERESVDTALLNKIGLVLRIDFFSFYSEQKEYKKNPMQVAHVNDTDESYKTASEQLKLLEQQNASLKTENEHLHKIISLLEEKYKVKPKRKSK
jgi:transcriptional regulator with XRE-family HTH domain